MTRHYFLTTSLGLTKEIADMLHRQFKVKRSDLCVISSDEAGLNQHQLRVANVFQKRDILLGAELGAYTGTALSLIMFCTTVMGMAFWVVDPALKPFIYLGSIGLPVLLLTGAGALLGSTREHHLISQYRHELDNGDHLLVIDSDQAHSVAIQSALADYESTQAGKDRVSPVRNAEYDLSRSA